jgi:hypothetical protein
MTRTGTSPDLKALLLTESARGELEIPKRGGAVRRPNPFVEEQPEQPAAPNDALTIRPPRS